MSDNFFLIRRFFANPRKKALISAFIVLSAIFFLETWLPLSSDFLLLSLVAFSAALSTYLLTERGERLKINVEAQTQALNQVISELEESRASFQQIIAQFPIPTIIIHTTTENPEYYNHKFVETFGYTVDETPTIDVWLEKACPDKAYRTLVQTVWREAVQGAIETETQIKTQEWDVVCKNGAKKRVLFDMIPIGEKSVITMNDITERKKTEQELQESEKRFRSLFRDTADAYLILDKNVFVDCNQATVEMLRANSKEEVLSTHPSQLSPEFQPDGRSSLEKADEMIRIALELGSNRFEWIHRRMNGEDFPAEVLLTPVSVGGKTIIHTVWRDITERKEAAKEILDTQNYLDSLIKAAPAGIGITINREIQFISQHFIDMLGYTKAELNGQNARILYPNDAEYERVGKQKYADIEEDGIGSIETTLKRKDGSDISVLMSSVPLDVNDPLKGITFVALDITERKAAEEALKTLNIELDGRVGQRTQELHQTISAMADREIRMIELKKVITQLRAQLRKAGLKPEAYDPLLGPDREW